MNAARNEIVARAFGGGGGEDGRLKFIEAFLPHFLAQEFDDFRAENDVVVELFAAKVEVAVLEAHFL